MMTTETVSADEYRAMAKPRRKYGNEPTTVDGIAFDSLAEARRYGELKLMEEAGEIVILDLQPRFPLVVNGVKVGEYRADFRYTSAALKGGVVIEDVKSPATKTPVYRLKKKLTEALYDVTILEVTT